MSISKASQKILILKTTPALVENCKLEKLFCILFVCILAHPKNTPKRFVNSLFVYCIIVNARKKGLRSG